jgi:hypothetical protein
MSSNRRMRRKMMRALFLFRHQVHGLRPTRNRRRAVEARSKGIRNSQRMRGGGLTFTSSTRQLRQLQLPFKGAQKLKGQLCLACAQRVQKTPSTNSSRWL